MFDGLAVPLVKDTEGLLLLVCSEHNAQSCLNAVTHAPFRASQRVARTAGQASANSTDSGADCHPFQGLCTWKWLQQSIHSHLKLWSMQPRQHAVHVSRRRDNIHKHRQVAHLDCSLVTASHVVQGQYYRRAPADTTTRVCSSPPHSIPGSTERNCCATQSLSFLAIA